MNKLNCPEIPVDSNQVRGWYPEEDPGDGAKIGGGAAGATAASVVGGGSVGVNGFSPAIRQC